MSVEKIRQYHDKKIQRIQAKLDETQQQLDNLNHLDQAFKACFDELDRQSKQRVTDAQAKVTKLEAAFIEKYGYAP